MYGLVGKKLEHSFSKMIHEHFGNNDYHLFEAESIEEFIRTVDFKGINITIPFKTDIIPLLDEMDEIAVKTQSVNTVIKRDGKLIGYNTDYYGLKESLGYKKISLENKKVLVLGNGGVSKTVIQLAKDQKANSIITLCRTARNEGEYPFKEAEKFNDYQILINTTPVGMYPHNDDCLLLNLDDFTKLEAVVDLIYNPFRTKLILAAEKKNLKTVNGLYMLTAQAKQAHEIFHNIEIPLNYANKVFKKIYHYYINYVFVGLPLSGKTKYANKIGSLLSKATIDIDKMIEDKEGLSIPTIFETHGEQVFRSMEKDAVENIYKGHNLAISTGGGLIESSYNMELLKQNGMIIFLNKDPNLIAKKKIYGRPLLKDPSNILVLANKRIPMYKEHSDIIINIEKNTEFHINEIKEKIDEYISR